MKRQERTPLRRALITLTVFFIVINAIAIVFNTRLEDKGVDTDVVIIGNLFLYLVSAISVWMYGKASNQNRPHGIVRNVYGGFMLKFFALIVAAMVYFYFAREINKPAIFICMGLYLVYNFAGVLQLVKRNANPVVKDHPHHPKQDTHHPHK